MKQKIKEALKQGHKKLGVSDEVFERVAASVETFITDESQIAGFVASEKTLDLLKSYQSMADKIRDLERINPQPNNETPKPSDDGNQPPKPSPEDKPGAPDDTVPAWAQAIINSNNELRESNKALSEKIAGFEAAKAKETAVAALDKFVNEWGYAKGFPSESELAKRIALKVYKAGGETMTGEQLIAAFREEFDPAVKAKGVTDFTKPFDSDGGNVEADLDMTEIMKIYRKSGRVADKKE
ncbi:MAG: hypothetical protein K2K45_05195 [Muribaculaceae bacterium]|nr:hypothetical protein [Muribaculaceae bacterium]